MPPKKKVKRNLTGLKYWKSKPNTEETHSEFDGTPGPAGSENSVPPTSIACSGSEDEKTSDQQKCYNGLSDDEANISDEDGLDWKAWETDDGVEAIIDGGDIDGEINLVVDRSLWKGKRLKRKGIYYNLVLAAIEGKELDTNCNEGDVEWLPRRKQKEKMKELRRKLAHMKRKGPQGPSGKYGIGPDIGSKSDRTIRRHLGSWSTQKTLDSHLGLSALTTSDESAAGAEPSSPDDDHQSQPLLPSPSTTRVFSEDPDEQADCFESIGPTAGKKRSRTVRGQEDDTDFEADESGDRSDDGDDADNITEPWEEELHEALTSNTTIRGWNDLKDQIVDDLKKKYKKLSLTEINQLIILRNFATLRIKGFGRIKASIHMALEWNDDARSSGVGFARRVRALARHYQIHEQLPIDQRGGYKNSRSILKDEAVRRAARGWLTEIPIGQVTSLKFQHGLNEVILPSLGLSTEKPLCERTARRWLVKLGWTKQKLGKGVYMDGHERVDVRHYRDNVFLPAMENYERRMTQFDMAEGNLVPKPPTLASGEKEIIACFHDETCFHANEFKQSAWLAKDQQILQKKSRGRLIHISDFIEEHNGRLVTFNPDGNITSEARKVIYPGSAGDAYWDSKQLIQQVIEQAIPVFEAAHPNCQALFIFDQSSAHAALADDALKAFEMNMKNGGAQRFQKDTVIPSTNPYLEHRGKIQKMTIPSPEDPGKQIQKGLAQVLQERGFNTSKMKAKCKPVCPHENLSCCMARLLSNQDDFKHQISELERVITDRGHLCIFLPKFHCELNPIEMYWGWAKHRYRQVYKDGFAAAKTAAIKFLDECPKEVIRRFVNRSWRFMSAYRKGLTGRAAAWAVRRYKGHRSISQGALMSIEAIA